MEKDREESIDVRWTESGDVVIRWELGVHEVWKRPSDRRERIRGRENLGWGREQSRIIYILCRRRRERGGEGGHATFYKGGPAGDEGQIPRG